MNRDRSREYFKKRHMRRAKFEFLRLVKLERGCLVCGYRRHHAALQFHHRDPPEKIFALARSENYPWVKILAEVDKCDVLCSNCHSVVEFDTKEVNQRAASVTAAQRPLKATSSSSNLERPTNIQEISGVC